MDVRPLANLLPDLTGDRIFALPLLVIYVADGCNSRCGMCDIWKLPRRMMDLALAERLAEDFARLGGRRVVLSGGEAMQHPQWPRIAGMFRAVGAKVTLISNALLLKKQAQQVMEAVDDLTVSLDGATPATYAAIRGVDGLELVLEGIQIVSTAGMSVTTRTTVQRRNYTELAQIVDVAKAAGARQASFLAVDVRNREAFGPRPLNEIALYDPSSPALSPDDLPRFAAVLDELEASHAADFESRFITESPAKLRRLHTYFAALHGLAELERPPCNAPHISAVVEVDGKVRPCYFLPAVAQIGEGGLAAALHTEPMRAMRRAYRQGERHECARCVCSLYRGPRSLLGNQ